MAIENGLADLAFDAQALFERPSKTAERRFLIGADRTLRIGTDLPGQLKAAAQRLAARHHLIGQADAVRFARIDALAEDCAEARIVVSAEPARRFCNGPQLVIDRIDIARAGGYAVWLGEPLRVETVEGERGRRPWSAQPPTRFKRRSSNTSG